MSHPGSNEWAFKHYGNPDSADFERKNIVAIDFCGRAMRVHKHAAPAFKRLERIFKNKAPDYAKGINDGQLDDWSYSNRNIAGSSVKSNHAFGLAIDINALRNARGTRGDMPGKVIDQAAREGIVNGRSWSNPDAMHFELHLTPQQIKTRYYPDGRKRNEWWAKQR